MTNLASVLSCSACLMGLSACAFDGTESEDNEVLGLTESAISADSSELFALRAQHSQKCLDMPLSGWNGELYQYDCHLGDNQLFALNADGTLQNRRFPGCMQLRSTGYGAHLFVAPCNATNPLQRFTYSSNTHEITTAEGLCLDVSGASTANEYVITWNCSGGGHQKFDRLYPYPKAIGATTPLQARHSGKCMDVPYPGGGWNGEIYQHQCHGGSNQQFTFYSDNSIRVSGKCLQLRSDGEGSHIFPANCDPYSNQQRFSYVPATEEIRTYNGRCLDVAGANASDDYILAWNCSGGRHQKFARVDPNNFKMVIAADPQLYWSCSLYTPCGRQAQGEMDQGKLSNVWQRDSINALSRKYPGILQGVIVNGDLTAFGKADQLEAYKSIFHDRLLLPVYPGLGNHDYANNVDDCDVGNPNWLYNGCAIGMTTYLASIVSNLPNRRGFDWQETGPYLSVSDGLVNDYSGSLAYSFDIGNVHFVQLNNYPSYTNWFAGLRRSPPRRETVTIWSSIPWLKRDLAQAKSEGKRVVINLHDPREHFAESDRTELYNILNGYDVIGVFTGHLHGETQVSYPPNDNGKIPWFASGSSEYSNYLLVQFTNGQVSTVDIVNSSYGNTDATRIYPKGSR